MTNIFVKLSVTAALLLPVTAAYSAADHLFVGTFPDGATMKWKCPAGTKGSIPFLFTLPTGESYQASVSCGEPV